MSKIGFVGVGNMGGPMARNLFMAGDSVRAYDLSEVALDLAVRSGAERAVSARDAATGVEFVITMLRDGTDVRNVFLNDGILASADPGTLFIDTSTIDVETSVAVHEAASAAGFGMLDAPVSGGTAGATKGTLTFMCGGHNVVFEKAKTVLAAMGKSFVHCGGPGQGQVVKVCNNMVAGIISLATAEAFVMGEKLGVDRNVLFNIMSTSSANSWVLNNVCPLPSGVPGVADNREFKPGFAAKLMLKDLRLSQVAAQISGSATPLGAAAAAAYQQHINNGHGDLDNTSICKLINPEIE